MNLQQQPSNRIKWPSAYFEASSSLEPFEEVHVVTAKSEFVSNACEIAANVLMKNGDFTEQQLNQYTQHVIASQRLSVYESVTISDTGISICINADNVEDDNVMWRALDMLADALDQLDNTQGTITFGDSLTFSISEVPWIISQ
jgi:hypothetical protein